MFLIVDTAIYERNLAGFEATHVEETIADLERSVGFPDGQPAAHGRALQPPRGRRASTRSSTSTRASCSRSTQPPFAAIDCSTDKVLWATFTLGGLRTTPDERGADARRSGHPRPLRRRPHDVSGIAAEGYVSGISLGDGTFFGRAAGRGAARG